jgi:hypothetical protein
MKRFLALAVTVAVSGWMAQAAAAVCSEDGGSFCQFATGCFEMSSEYSSAPGCAEGECTCEQVIANCKANGSIYAGVDKSNPGMGAPTWGGGVQCADAGGTLVGAAGPEACKESGVQLYCRWNTSCWDISTDPTGANSGAPVTSCAAAIEGCETQKASR